MVQEPSLRHRHRTVRAHAEHPDWKRVWGGGAEGAPLQLPPARCWGNLPRKMGISGTPEQLGISQAHRCGFTTLLPPELCPAQGPREELPNSPDPSPCRHGGCSAEGGSTAGARAELRGPEGASWAGHEAQSGAGTASAR